MFFRKVRPTIEGIGVANPDPITLKSNEQRKLIINLSPEGSDIREVSCIPDDPAVAYIKRDEKNEIHVIANEKLNDNKEHRTEIKIQGGEADKIVKEVIVQPTKNKDDSTEPKRELEGANR